MVDTRTALQAREDLAWVADHWSALQARLQPPRNPDASGGGRSTTIPLPIDPNVSDLLAWIENETRAYALTLLHETDDWTPTTSFMPGLLREVSHRYGHFTAHEDQALATAFVEYAKRARWRTTRALNPAPAPRYIGPCPHHGCTGDLYVKGAETAAVCPECDTPTTLYEEQVFLHDQLEYRLLTQAELRTALNILNYPTPRTTLHRWIATGRLPEATPGRYRLAEALTLATRRRTPDTPTRHLT